MGTKESDSSPPPPPGFRVDRAIPVGRHPILAVFPGLDRLGPASRIETDPGKRARLFDETCIEVVDQDLWMYVAPWETPPFARRRGWNPVVAPGKDCIVVGQGHLRDSPEMILYLDIYHELCHILQRRAGANLWEPGLSYVERTTEVDAYRFVVQEAKSLGVPDAYLREYLMVEWISKKEHLQLLEAVGVPPPPRARAPPRS
ncbi:MAG TPA: hypothetical protein VEH10_03615 [Thermoplasmata archaeon]|nr:hypothetical protein [Thermoplasmata archaeon]